MWDNEEHFVNYQKQKKLAFYAEAFFNVYVKKNRKSDKKINRKYGVK